MRKKKHKQHQSRGQACFLFCFMGDASWWHIFPFTSQPRDLPGSFDMPKEILTHYNQVLMKWTEALQSLRKHLQCYPAHPHCDLDNYLLIQILMCIDHSCPNAEFNLQILICLGLAKCMCEAAGAAALLSYNIGSTWFQVLRLNDTVCPCLLLLHCTRCFLDLILSMLMPRWHRRLHPNNVKNSNAFCFCIR